MNKTIRLQAKLKAAKAELTIRTRTHNSASRAFNKVIQKIADLETQIGNLAQISK